MYDVYLLRQTEHRLIAESVVTGETYRAAYLAALGRSDDEHRAPNVAFGDAPGLPDDAPYQPIGAQIDFFQPVLPSQQATFPRAAPTGSPGERAGAAIAPILPRAQTFNMSAIRVLFERFFTTERDHGGTGLGLAIVRAIAESRGGSATALFDARGTMFTVVL